MRIGKFDLCHDNIVHWSIWQRLIVILLVCVVSTAMSYLLSVYLFYGPLQNARMKQERLKQNFMQLEQRLRQMQAYKQQMQQIEKTLQTVSNALANHTTLSATLAKITALGKNAGLHIKNLQPFPVEHQRFFSKVPIRIYAQGNFHQILDFINRLAQDKNYLLLGDFKLSKSKPTADESLLDFTFTINRTFLSMPTQHDHTREK